MTLTVTLCDSAPASICGAGIGIAAALDTAAGAGAAGRGTTGAGSITGAGVGSFRSQLPQGLGAANAEPLRSRAVSKVGSESMI